jgi:predicted metal-dependent hydrolase
VSASRYAPQRAFPAYAFLPGRDPHPTGDPAGHSYSRSAPVPAAYFERARWRDNADYLYGVDLYNHGFLWEAHEAWEGLWHSAKHDALQAEFLQGLIQCAAAALKVSMQQPRGVEKLAAFGLARLERVAREAAPDFMGLDVLEFAREFRAFAESAPTSAEARPRIRLAS